MEKNFFLQTKVINQRSYGERALWRAVILQAFVDSLTESKRTEEQIARHTARGWLLGMCADFRVVCSMAGYDPNDVKRKAQKFMNGNTQLITLIRKTRSA